MTSFTVKRITTQGGIAHYVYLDDKWVGFMLKNEATLPDAEVLTAYETGDILWQDTFDYSCNYTFGDVPLAPLIRRGAVAVVCETNYREEQEPYEQEVENKLRVVKVNYEETASHPGWDR